MWLLLSLAFALPARQDLPASWLEAFDVEDVLFDWDPSPGAAELEASLALVPENPTAAYHLALRHADEEPATAFAWLERAADWGWRDVAVLEWDPLLEPLRDLEPERFAALVERCRAAAVEAGPARRAVRPMAGWRPPTPVVEVLPLEGARVALQRADGSASVVDLSTGRDVVEWRSSWRDRWRLGPVRALRASADGRGLVVESAAGGVRVLDGSRVRVRLPRHGELSPYGRSLVTERHPGVLSVVEVPTGRERFSAGSLRAPLRAHAWSADGSHLAVADARGEVRVLDALTGEPTLGPFLLPGPPDLIELSPDGRRLLTRVGSADLRLWDVATGASTRCGVQAWVARTLRRAEFDPTGRRVVLVTDEWPNLHALDAGTGAGLWMNPDVFWSPGDVSVTASRVFCGSHAVALEGGETLFHGDGLHCLREAGDGRWIVGLREERLVVIDGESYEERYTRWERYATGQLVVLPSGVHAGPGVRYFEIEVDGEWLPLETYAPLLFDPRRVEASMAGVPVSSPPLPPPAPSPTLASGGEVLRGDPDEPLVIEAVAQAPVLGWQVEADGTSLDQDELSVEEVEGRSRLTLHVEYWLGREDELTIRTIGPRGVLSRPLAVTVIWD